MVANSARIGTAILFSALCLSCQNNLPTERPAHTLDDALASVIRDKDVLPLAIPRSPFKTAWVFVPHTGQLLTECWSAKSTTGSSLAGLSVAGTDSLNGQANVAAALLKGAGIGISAGTSDISAVSLTLNGWTVESSDLLDFNWDSPGCWDELRENGMPVTTQVLEFGSMKAEITTKDGKRIALDSAALKRSDVKVSASGGAKWALSSSGQLNAVGDSIAVGYNLLQVTARKFTCPTTGSFALQPAAAFQQLPSTCPGGNGWYSVRATSSDPASVTLEYQEMDAPAAQIQTHTARLGEAFTLARYPRRLDQAVVQRDPTGAYALVITRFDLMKSTHAGSDPSVPLAHSELNRPISAK